MSIASGSLLPALAVVRAAVEEPFPLSLVTVQAELLCPRLCYAVKPFFETKRRRFQGSCCFCVNQSALAVLITDAQKRTEDAIAYQEDGISERRRASTLACQRRR